MFPQDEIKYETRVAVDGTPRLFPVRLRTCRAFITELRIEHSLHVQMVHHRIYPLFMFDRHLGVTQNIIQYPLHHMPYAPGKFEVATSNDLGGDAFTRKFFV